ncbi:MAG: SHD1 domain-containing protein [Kiritimatiellae bacterium]|nr:SHD1 domain-containing protein [Kiritimatiellia bacterium]
MRIKTITNKETKPLTKPSADKPEPVDYELRTWTAKDGVRIQAAFVRKSGPLLVLKTEDNKEVRILLQKLSEEDQDYMTSLKL